MYGKFGTPSILRPLDYSERRLDTVIIRKVHYDQYEIDHLFDHSVNQVRSYVRYHLYVSVREDFFFFVANFVTFENRTYLLFL